MANQLHNVQDLIRSVGIAYIPPSRSLKGFPGIHVRVIKFNATNRTQIRELIQALKVNEIDFTASSKGQAVISAIDTVHNCQYVLAGSNNNRETHVSIALSRIYASEVVLFRIYYRTK